MNRGEIPGFIYDEEKGKYFRIQANHQVSATAKHAEGNVKKQQRRAKKRKIEQKQRIRRLQRTVKRSPGLEHPVLGLIGLNREHGTLSPGRAQHAQDQALITHWRPRVFDIKVSYGLDWYTNISIVHYLPSTQQLVYGLKNSGSRTSHVAIAKRDQSDSGVYTTTHDMVALSRPITSIAAIENETGSRILVCAADSLGQVGNSGTIHVGHLGNDENDLYPRKVYSFSHGHYPLAARFNILTQEAAVLSSENLQILNVDAEIKSSLDLTAAAAASGGADWRRNDILGPSVDWLDANTVAFNFNSMRNTVMLWDTRTPTAVSGRFNANERTTGVTCLANIASSSSEHHILISTNRSIGLYDKRMPHSEYKVDQTVLSFPHVHEGPELRLAANGRTLVTAVDRDNIVQLYSTQTGRSLGPLETPQGKTRETPLGSLQWYDDDRDGHCLQACDGNGVVRWQWSGIDAPEDEFE